MDFEANRDWESVMFKFSQRSLRNLDGVHPDLVRVAKRALEISTVDFMVTEGLRTKQRQQVLYAAGATRMLNSRHLTGHAIDLAAWVSGGIRWDWPLYHRLADAMKTAAAELGVSIVWGGDWRSFKDGPHFELSWKDYPK
jgi:peptidoglycan L-alanyl-D-glutamate endopeptidase CwlK